MIKVRNSEEQVVGGSNKLLMTGVASVKLKAVGSDVDTLTNELGYENAKEGKPCYDVTSDGHRRVRVDFWLETEKGSVWKEAFFIEETPNMNTDKTKTEFVNAVGQFAFGDTEGNAPSYDWYNQTGVRPAFKGELEFVEFVRALGNLKSGKDGDVISIDFNKLFNGDLSDFKKFQKDLASVGNSVQVLLMVRKVETDKVNYYQAMNRKMYARPYESAFVKFQKVLNSQYNGVKDGYTYQNSLELKPFEPTTVNVTEGAETTNSVAAAPWA
jgi:hypothetical protein